jgi:glycosyltransferase involved in cell wall biosynthesis
MSRAVHSPSRLQRRPRIIITGPPAHAVSGIATHVRLLLDSAVARGFAFEHLCAGGEGLAETSVGRVLRHVRTPVRLFAMLMTERPALVHINTSLNARALPRDVMLLFVAWLTRCPVIWQVHGGRSILELAQTQPKAVPLLRLLLSVPRRVIVVSRQDEQGYAKVVAASRLRRISNAVHVPEQRERTAPDSALRVTYMGRLVAGKGVLDLLDAMRIIVHEHAEVPIYLQLAGVGPLEAQLTAAIAVHGLADRVQVLGLVEGAAKHRLLQQTDVFVLPTCLPERLPYALLESMAAGIPAVACAVGGVTEVVQDGLTGLLIAPHRPDLLASAIIELARDRQLLQQMSRAARERICVAHDLAHMAARFSALYEEVLDERRRA